MATFSANEKNVKHRWYVIDAQGCTLGRLASEVAHLLKGKHKPEYTPHVDTGDYVVVVNAASIGVTGRKRQQKTYYHHTGYPGGIKSMTLEKRLAKSPESVIHDAVFGMLPRNPLGRKMLSKLKVYAGEAHQHVAQQPEMYKTIEQREELL